MKKILLQVSILFILTSSFSFGRLSLAQYQREIASIERKIQTTVGQGSEIEQALKMVEELKRLASLNAPVSCEGEQIIFAQTAHVMEGYFVILLEYDRLDKKNSLSNIERQRMQELQVEGYIYDVSLQDHMNRFQWAFKSVKNKTE